MQTTKLFELLAVAVAFASADYGASAQTSDSIDTSKLVPADTSSVSSTTDAIQPDKMRSLRTVDTPAATIGEERVPTAAAGIANERAAAETVFEATARKSLAEALSTNALAVRKSALGKKENVNKPASRTRAEKVSSPASLTQAAGIAKGTAIAETAHEATASMSLKEYLLTKVGRRSVSGLKSFENVKKAPKKAKDGKTLAYQMYWPRKVEIMGEILPHLESGQPLSTILEVFPHDSDQHFIQGVAEFMEETNVPEMKRNIQHLLNQDRNEIDILFSFESRWEPVEDIKYSVIVFYTRLLSHEKVRKMVFDLLDRGLSKEEMLLEMQKAEGGAFLPGSEKRLKRFYDEWSFAKGKAK